MGYVDYESNYIREAAFMLVLAGIGMKQWYGFESRRKESFSQEEVNRMYAYLYQEEMIEIEDGKVRLAGPLNDAISIIVQSPYSMVMKTSTMIRICYFHEKRLAVFEYGRQDVGKLRFSLWDEASFMEYLKELEIFPEEEFMETDLEGFAYEEEYLKAEFSIADKKTGEIHDTMKLTEAGIFTFQITKDHGKEKKSLYVKKACEDKLIQWFRLEE